MVEADSPDQLWLAYEKILCFFEKLGLILVTQEKKSNPLNISFTDHQMVIDLTDISLKDGSKPKNLVAYIIRLKEILRQERRLTTKEEYLAIQVAKYQLLQGANIDYPYQDWGTSGFRKTQTWMSITDPGEGHIYGTASQSEYLAGIITHIEHLERGNAQRYVVEGYRIPNIKDVAMVRLAIGSDSPISSYIGRPIFESGFAPGLLKTVNTIASAVSQMFALGLCECKIAIENMTATEAIHFMRCIAGAVKRDSHRQILSAAFNINTKILDDRQSRPYWVKNRFSIGLLGIELTQAGGFNKVTWDGNSDSYPSKCVLEQLSHAEAVELVHKAHEKGLLTYFSAGFRYHHLSLAVSTGVDGVGVGGTQIVRYFDSRTGYHGPFKPENISEILKIRDFAANTWQGKAGALLSRLDRMYYESSLTVKDNLLRLELFKAVKAQNQEICEEILEKMSFITQLPVDNQHSLLKWGQRLILLGETSLMAKGKTREQWNSFIASLKKAMNDEDIDLLADLLINQTITPSLYPISYFSSQIQAA